MEPEFRSAISSAAVVEGDQLGEAEVPERARLMFIIRVRLVSWTALLPACLHGRFTQRAENDHNDAAGPGNHADGSCLGN